MKNIEIWKTYPEISWVEGSSLGRVRTLDRYVTDKDHGKRFVKGRILKLHDDGRGYMQVGFKLNGKYTNRKVHRIIATCFISNPYKLSQVNHKDCDRKNNQVENLEWCSASYNNKYREKFGKAISKANAQKSPVFAIKLSTRNAFWFESQREAERILKIEQTYISRVVRGVQSKTHGFWFTSANSSAVEETNRILGSVVADKVKKLMDREDKVEQQ